VKIGAKTCGNLAMTEPLDTVREHCRGRGVRPMFPLHFNEPHST
jgi:hypothetical protein